MSRLSQPESLSNAAANIDLSPNETGVRIYKLC